MQSRKPLWTLDELCDRVEPRLAVDYAGQASGRVRDVPDRRTIRYYTTLGLIDRPAAMRGRTALYGVRHLLQLAAVKRLQAQGLSLAEVQERLVGLTDAALRELARLPADFDAERPLTPNALSPKGRGKRGPTAPTAGRGAFGRDASSRGAAQPARRAAGPRGDAAAGDDAPAR